ncbi:putative mRNA interferase PemK [Paenibacillus sp. 598K]|uniref:type II toxin-antitoxin system PemK/MazF family toxin n=1 Tax=Paenibacillus sp. 598K TaxID=1117987 RepID=UPI000FFA99A9|nr:type II toxin-antitoxin system PemK/MazF family toxin [Paenibacillus sp. 598K]GBF73177.1 putative mRNA interferase PemK [Paenibacillus sp. 598K]
MKVQRGEIYMADFDDAKGSEQRGKRPVLVIQNDIGNDRSPTTIVAAISYETRRYMHTHVLIKPNECGLPAPSAVMLEQIRTVSQKRLGRYIGKLSDYRMEQVDRAIQISLGLIEFTVRGGKRDG